MRKYNAIISIILIVFGAVGIFLSLNFEARGGNVGDPGAAFWPILLCCGLIFTSGLLLVQTMLQGRKAAEPEEDYGGDPYDGPEDYDGEAPWDEDDGEPEE